MILIRMKKNEKRPLANDLRKLLLSSMYVTLFVEKQLQITLTSVWSLTTSQTIFTKLTWYISALLYFTITLKFFEDFICFQYSLDLGWSNSRLNISAKYFGMRLQKTSSCEIFCVGDLYNYINSLNAKVATIWKPVNWFAAFRGYRKRVVAWNGSIKFGALHEYISIKIFKIKFDLKVIHT